MNHLFKHDKLYDFELQQKTTKSNREEKEL